MTIISADMPPRMSHIYQFYAYALTEGRHSPFDLGLFNLRSLYMFIVHPKFSVTKVSG